MNPSLWKVHASIVLSFFVCLILPLQSSQARSEKDSSSVQSVQGSDSQSGSVRGGKKDRLLSEKYTGKKLEKAHKAMKERGEYRFLVESSGGLDAVRASFSLTDGGKVDIKKVSDTLYMVKIPQDTPKFSRELSKVDTGIIPSDIAGYTVIEPEVFQAFATPPDLSGEELDKLWWMDSIGLTGAALGLSPSDKIQVAVLDTGIDSTHGDISANYNPILSYDFVTDSVSGTDDNGHGTQVAGVLGGAINSSGIFGTYPDADIVSLRVLDADGLGTSYDVLEALLYARDKHISVLNMSFGGLVGDTSTNPICQAITELKHDNIFTVVSAGNTNQEVINTLPAACGDAITVGSSTRDGQRASFSNFGTLVDFYAPGVDIYTSTIGGGYTFQQGTSFSAPIVSGLIAREMVRHPTASYNQILSALEAYPGLSLTPSSGETSTGATYTGSTLSGATSSGAMVTVTPPDYSTYKYYSGIFQKDGKTYGNSLYSDEVDISGADMNQIQIYTYSEYQSILASRSEVFQAMSVPMNGLIGEWKLDGNANDTSGNGNNGTATNVNWLTESGRLVGYFNGVDSYISLPNLGNPDEITISLFAKSQIDVSGTMSARGLFHSDMSQLGMDNGLQVTDYAGIVYLLIGDAYGLRDILNSGVSNNQWKNRGHYLLTYKKSTKEYNLYYDGQLTLSGVSNYTPSANWLGLPRIGWSYGDGFPRHYNGNISDVRIYNRVLSNSEIQELYNDGLGIVNNNTPYNLPDLTYSALYNNPLLSYSNLEQSSRVYQTNEQLSENNATQQTKENTKGDPVHLATGEFTYENTLMSVPGSRVPYTLDVYYTNQNYYNGPLGINWDHSYNLYLSEESNGNVLFYNGRLGVYRFIKNGDNYDYNIGLGATLSYSGGLYTLTYASGKIYQFNSINKVSNISDTFGDVFDFTYSGGLLSQVTDSLGRNYTYTYAAHNRLEQVTDTYGRKAEFNYYDGTTLSGSIYDLENIILNNGSGATRTIGFTYTTGGDNRDNHNIVDLIDAKGQVYVSNTYEDDRVKTQKYGTGTITYTYTLSGSSVVENNIIDRLGNQTVYVYDTYGNNTELRQYTATGTQSYIYAYNTGGQLISETRPRGNGYTYLYDNAGRVTSKRMKADMTQADGASDLVTTLTYDSHGNVTQIVEPIGKTTNLTYTGVSLLARSETILGTGTVVQTYTYDSLGRLVDKRDALGNPTLYVYDTLSLPTQIKTGTGTEQITTSYTYDTYGNLLTLTDGSGSVTSYSYDVFSRLVSETSPEGVVKIYTYDANNNKTASSVALGGGLSVSTSTIYDALDHPASTTQEVSEGVYAIVGYKYNGNGNLTETLYPNGLRETRTYNTLGKLATVTQSGSVLSTTSYTYDANGNLISENKNGNITSYTYDLYDRLIRTTDALGGYRTLSYDKASNILTNQFYTSTGLLMQETGYTYDILSRLTKMSEKKLENSTYRDTSYTYDKNGNKLTEKNALNYTTTYTYDSLGRQRTKTLPNGLQYENVYDKANNIIAEKDISSSGTITLTHTYDEDNRRLSTQDNLGNTTSYEYNQLGQIVHTTDPSSIDTLYTYDYRGNILTETRAGKTLTYTYDLMGNRTGLTDALGNTTSYGYHAEGQTASETQYYTGGVTRATSYLFDTNGNLWKKTDANGTVITHTYDALNRLTRKDISGSQIGGVTFEIFSYDALSRIKTTNTSQGWATLATYDSLSNLTNDKNGTASASVSAIYDILGRTTARGVHTYTYDNIDRITSVATNEMIYTYSQRSLLSEKHKNNRTKRYTYDSIGRLSTVSGSGYISPLTYTYDQNSNILSKGANTYTYNNRDELTRTVYAPGTLSMSGSSYTYDLMGNRQSESNISNITLSGETLTPLWNYQTGSQNTYTSIIAGSGLTYTGVSLSGTILYDSNGNTRGNQFGTQKQYEFKYDYNNRLTKVERYTTPTTKVTLVDYQYDALGRRAYSKSPTDITYHYYFNNYLTKTAVNVLSGTQLTSEYATTIYFYGAGGEDDVVASYQDIRKKIGSTYNYARTYYYYEKNHLGSIEKISNNSGSVIEEYEYTPFGGTYIKNAQTQALYPNQYIPLSLYNSTLLPTISNAITGSIWGNTRLYTGREYDRETGLYYMRARHYDLNSGRFLQHDPIGTSDDINLYRYVKNNPLNFTDRDGLKGKPAIPSFGYDIIGAIGDNLDIINSLLGKALIVGGATGLATTGPACVAATSITLSCVTYAGGLTLASGGAGTLSFTVCLPSSVTAGASCGAAGLSATALGLGTYMTAKSNSDGGTGNKPEYKKSKSGLSGKERANDIPSWANGERPFSGESGKDFSRRIMDEKYGKGNWEKFRKDEFSQIKKYGDRNFE